MATAATTLEKLFAEVFQRRDRTVSKVKIQTQIVYRNLASKLLIQGLTPPTWLLSDDDDGGDDCLKGISKEELHTQKNKEELITGLLLPRPPLTLSHFNGECSWYSKQGAYSSDVELRGDTRPETCIEWIHEKSGHIQSQPQFTASQCQLSFAAATPQDHAVERIGDFCPDSDLSLTRVQRSRSRQKALELRSSSKTGSKSCFGKRSNASVCSSDAAFTRANDHNGVLEFTKPFPRTVEDVFVERVSENGHSAGIQRSGCKDVEEREAGIPASTETSNNFVKNLMNVGSLSEGVVLADPQPDENGCHVQDSEGVKSSPPRILNPFLHELDAKLASSSSLQADDGQLEAEQAAMASSEGKILGSLSLAECKAVADIEVSEVDALTASGREDRFEKEAMVEFTPAISGHGTEVGSSAAQGVPLSNLNLSTGTKVSSTPKSTEAQFLKLESNCSFQAAKGASWPQIKRRKIESELSRISDNLDAGVSSLGCVSDAELHQEAVRPERKSTSDLLEEKVEMTLEGSTVVGSLILNDGRQSTALVAAEMSSSYVEEQEVNAASSLVLSGGQYDNLSHTVDKFISTMSIDDGQLEVVQADGASSERKTQASLSHCSCEAVADAEVPEVDSLASTVRVIGLEQASMVELTPSFRNETEVSSSSAQCAQPFHFNFSTDKSVAGCPTFTEAELAKLETHSKIHSAEGASWPQLKRRKIQSELSRMSYNLDAGVSSLISVLDALVHQKVAHSEKKPSSDLRDEKVKMSIGGSTVMESLILDDGQQSTALVDAEAKNSFVEAQEMNVAGGLILSGGKCDSLSHTVDKSISTVSMDQLTSARISGHKRKSLQEDNFDTSVVSPEMEFMDVIGSDETIPMFEALIAENEKDSAYFSRGAVKFEEIHLSGSTVQRASILERVCKYVTLHTPSSHIASEYESFTMPTLAHSSPDGSIKRVDLENRLPLGDSSDQLAQADYLSIDGDQSSLLTGIYNSDSAPLPSAPSRWDSRMPYLSPIRNSFEGISSKSGGSSKPGSSNADLVCFPIEEDAESCDEYAEVNDTVDTYKEKKCSKAGITPAARQPLRDITAAENINLYLDIEAEKSGSDSITHETTANQMPDMSAKENGSYYTRSRRNNLETDDQSYSVGASSMKKSAMKHKSRMKNQKLSENPGIRSEGKNFSAKGKKFTNIVSNVKSFIPLVQQKQAATLEAANLARRETRLKALEAAETAKRLEEKRENERKQKKEALKLERARLKEENQRQLEVQKKLKEEEKKKKEAEIAARKKQREEEEKKEKERKRRRTEDARKHQRDQEAKVQAVPKEQNCKLPGETVHDRASELNHPMKLQSNAGTSFIDELKAFAASSLSGKVEDKGSTTPMLGRNGNSTAEACQEPSYEISPYQCSDDELDEEDEDKPKKFIPTWGRKSAIAQALPATQNMDPDMIFPLGSFCSMDEVLLPRMLQRRLRAG